MKSSAAAPAAERSASPDADGALLSDPTTLSLDQLMNMRLSGPARSDPAEVVQGQDRPPPETGDSVPTPGDLPADLTTLNLGDLLNLRVRAGPKDEDEEKDKKTDKDETAPQDNGEDPAQGQQIAADGEGAAAAQAAAGEGEGQQGDGQPGQGEGEGPQGEGGPGPPQTSGGDSSETGTADFGQAIKILPAELVFVAALQSANTVPVAPSAPPAAAAPSEVRATAQSAPPPNAAPVAKDDSAATATQTAVTFSVLGNDVDPEGAPLHVAAVTQAANGTVTINADGTLTYAPKAGFFGTDKFAYTVSDGNGGSSTATVTVNVAPPVNDPPVAGDDKAATDAGAAVTFTVLGNDTDANGDSLTISAVTQGANGTVAINQDGTLTYAPKANFAGTDTFTYTISDGRGGSDTASVTVEVRPVNAPPIANADAVATDEDMGVTFNVLGNDSDANGDSLGVAAVTQGAHGSVAINQDGTLSYTPTANFVGTDTFTYTISDGRGATDSALVTVVVRPVNDAPVAGGDTVTTNEDVGFAINVLANDSDADGDPLGVIAFTQGANGAVFANPDGTLVYASKLDFAGTDTFTYTISDGHGGTATATVTVVVRPVNDVPIAGADSAKTKQGQPVSIAILGNDSDVDGDPLSVTAVTQGANGTVGVNSDGTLTYVPAPGFAGTDTFTYTISDGSGGTATATVTVVVAPSAPPTAGDSLAAMEPGTPISGTLTAADADNTAGELRFALAAAPAHGTATVQPDGTYSYTPAAGFTGTDRFTFSVTDPTGASSSAAVTVTVVPNAFDATTGAEFGVNTATNNAQQAPDMARLADGSIVVTWQSQNQDGNNSGVYAQRFDATGRTLGGEFQVNTFVQGAQQAPAVAALAAGGFVIVWDSQNQDGSNSGVYAQRYDAAGGAAGGEFQVNAFVQGAQQAPAVAALADGGFVVVWESENQDGSNFGVYAQRYDAAGGAVGGEFQVNTFVQGAQQAPTVVALADGGFVVVWESQNQDGNNSGVYAQRYDAAGGAVGGEFQVNTFVQGAQQAPTVAALADGGFVVVWESQNQDGNNFGVYAQRYDAAGGAVGGEFQVNTFVQGAQQAPAVAALADGGYVIVWESQNQDGNNFGVYGQRFDGGGNAIGPEFQLNTTTANLQGAPAAVMLADGSLAVTWQSVGQDGSAEGIFGRIFDATAPVAHTFTGGAGNDSVSGGPLADTFSGGAGDDLLIGGGGGDHLDGGPGVDTASYRGSPTGVTVDLVSGTGVGGDAQGDTLVNMENLVGSDFNDSLTGDANGNQLDGSLGVDQLFGGSGDDVLLWDPADAAIDGAAGLDTLLVRSGDIDLVGFTGKMAGIDAADLASDAGANSLTLNAKDILDISDAGVLTVLGDGHDSVNAGRGWAQAGMDGHGNAIYTQTVGVSVVTLIVDSDILLNNDILQ